MLLLFLVEGRLVLVVHAGMALILLTGSSLNLVCLVSLLLVAVSETKTLDVSVGFEVFFGPERTEFEVRERIATCSLTGRLLAAERTEFQLILDVPLGSPLERGSPERTEFCCK